MYISYNVTTAKMAMRSCPTWYFKSQGASKYSECMSFSSVSSTIYNQCNAVWKLSSAVRAPAAQLTPCLVAADALLLCQTTVICDWASIDRATSLSSWDYSRDIIAAARQHLIKGEALFIPCLLSFLFVSMQSKLVMLHQVSLAAPCVPVALPVALYSARTL